MDVDRPELMLRRDPRKSLPPSLDQRVTALLQGFASEEGRVIGADLCRVERSKLGPAFEIDVVRDTHHDRLHFGAFVFAHWLYLR
jgi:hypothetical protein